MIYFVQAVGGGPVKIGYTGDSDMKMRLPALQTGSPVPLRVIATIPGTRRDETDLHRKFHRLRLHGEWFEPAPELREGIRHHVRLGGLRLTGQVLKSVGTTGQPYYGTVDRRPVPSEFRRIIRMFVETDDVWLVSKTVGARLGSQILTERQRTNWAKTCILTLYRRGWLVRRERSERDPITLTERRVIEFALREFV